MCWETEEGGFGGKSWLMNADRFGSLHNSRCRQSSAEGELQRSVRALVC